MKAFMTIGTLRFLRQLVKKHDSIHFYLMNNIHEMSSLAYYEAAGKSVFAAGHTYDIFLAGGQMEDQGFVVMNNIPVTNEGQPVFEDRFKQRQGSIEKMPGFQAFRLLKPIRGNEYIILTQWARQTDYEAWATSDEFVTSHDNPAVKPPAYFASRPFMTSYTMADEEDEEH